LLLIFRYLLEPLNKMPWPSRSERQYGRRHHCRIVGEDVKAQITSDLLVVIQLHERGSDHLAK